MSDDQQELAALPIGGSTGLDHSDNPAIDEAVSWLASLPSHQLPRPPVPFLRRQFGLTPKEACIALREAALGRARAT